LWKLGCGIENPKKEKNKVLRSEKKVVIMFSGMFMRKPDKAVALKHLKSHIDEEEDLD